MLNELTPFACILFLLPALAFAAERRIPVAEYEDKVYAAWLGQCIGNMYGIPHEFKYNDEPRTEPITGWADAALDRIKQSGGAFSDDDTDIEYVDLFLMEKYGPEPTYEQVAEFWKRHINRFIWVANRAARDLMDKGYLPPLTGRKGINYHWYQIDPQLVCEIWAVTAPGMLDYAAAKADWAAKVTNDDYGTHPTIWYNTMYAAAFFESDVEKLCQIGYEAVPEGSIFREAIDDVRKWKAEYGQDWVAVRKKIKEKYHDKKGLREGIKTTQVGAILNGTLGVAALLYGEGDFEKTLNFSCQMGYDADNQCATLAGLLAITMGSEALPRKYTHVLEGWDKPLNDFYKNLTRDELPDGKLTDIAARTAKIGKDLVVKKGGRIEGDTLVINTDATFKQPLEARLFPVYLHANEDTAVNVEILGGDAEDVKVSIEGGLPPGLKLERRDNRPVVVGRTTQKGRYDVKLTVSDGATRRTTTLPLFVGSPNLAKTAQRVLLAVTEPTGYGNRHHDTLRDGDTSFHYDSFNGKKSLELDYYGYEWKDLVQVSRVVFYSGPVMHDGGWFETLTVQYRDETLNWVDVEDLKIDPPYGEANRKRERKTYTMTFKPVSTLAIRIVGKPGGSSKFTSITELEVFE